MKTPSTQQELLSVAPANEADDRLQKQVEEIYQRGGNIADFFKRLEEKSADSEGSEELDGSVPDAILFLRS